MPINFHDSRNKRSYAAREADRQWLEVVRGIVGKGNMERAVDIGCGGGIYTKALSELGFTHIIGIDSSEVMLEQAKESCRFYDSINFQKGEAVKTGLPAETFDLVLERALIHHLTDLSSCFIEAVRLLHKDGCFIIQDRTPEDCLLPGSSQHIRGYIFDKFPRLAEIETNRRHGRVKIAEYLQKAGFSNIQSFEIWETRKEYASETDLLTDLRNRTGRSILHELSDKELSELLRYVEVQVGKCDRIIDKDRWTIWKAEK